MFLFLHLSDIHSSMTHLHVALQHIPDIPSQVTDNRLTLNSSKTVFLFIGLKQQLSNCRMFTKYY